MSVRRQERHHVAVHREAARRRKAEGKTYDWEQRECELCGGSGTSDFLGQPIACPRGCQ